jgi:hypothetical protein
MLELRKLNHDDALQQWTFVTALPADENGFTNPYQGVSYEEYLNSVLPEQMMHENPVNMPDYKPTAIALSLALELNLEETKDLIGRAGYTLTNSSKFDLIIRYFIENRNYNIVEINIALYDFDQSLLGA